MSRIHFLRGSKRNSIINVITVQIKQRTQIRPYQTAVPTLSTELRETLYGLRIRRILGPCLTTLPTITPLA